jgi:hypothetical protein
MTNQHPITPPPELVEQWRMDYMSRGHAFIDVAKEIARWGADQELKACCECISTRWNKHNTLCLPLTAHELRTVRRPKPPSLKEKALEALKVIECEYVIGATTETIRRALKQLPND